MDIIRCGLELVPRHVSVHYVCSPLPCLCTLCMSPCHVSVHYVCSPLPCLCTLCMFTPAMSLYIMYVPPRHVSVHYVCPPPHLSTLCMSPPPPPPPPCLCTLSINPYMHKLRQRFISRHVLLRLLIRIPQVEHEGRYYVIPYSAGYSEAVSCDIFSFSIHIKICKT